MIPYLRKSLHLPEHFRVLHVSGIADYCLLRQFTAEVSELKMRCIPQIAEYTCFSVYTTSPCYFISREEKQNKTKSLQGSSVFHLIKILI